MTDTAATPQADSASSTVPDENLTAERAVLGALLARPTLLRLVLRFLRPEDFRDPRSRAVFEAMHEAYRAAPKTANERSRTPRTDARPDTAPAQEPPTDAPAAAPTGAAPGAPPSLPASSAGPGKGPTAASNTRPPGPPREAAPTKAATASQTAATEAAANQPQTYAQRLHQALAARGIDEGFVRGLVESCPDPDRAAVYGRMVMIDRVRAQVGDLGGQLAASARAAVGNDGRLAVPLGHLDQLAAALSDLDGRWGPRQSAAEEGGTATAGSKHRPAADAATAAREDAVLADLTRHPTQVAAVAEWLRPEDFQTPGRGRAYAAIRALAQRGDPIDPVTLVTEARQRGALAVARSGDTGETPPRHARALTADELLALANTDVAVGTAVESGREVLRAATLATVAHHAQAIADLHTANLSADDLFSRAGQNLAAMQEHRARLAAAGLDPTATRAMRQNAARRWRSRGAPDQRQVTAPKVIPAAPQETPGIRRAPGS